MRQRCDRGWLDRLPRRVLLLVIGLTAALVQPTSGVAESGGEVASGWSPDREVALRLVSADEACLSSLTSENGVLWRAGSCSSPGYTTSSFAGSEVNSTETQRLRRSLPDAMLNIDEYTEPVYYASSGTPMRTVKCVSYGCVGGSQAPLTGNELVGPGGDSQVIVVDTLLRRTYELWNVVKDAGGTVKVNSDGTVTAGSMSVVDMDGRGNKTADGQNLNITGAGVSRAFGLIMAHEVKAAASNPQTAIPHALSVSLPSAMNCSNSFREPATKTDGRASGGSCVAEGARIVLAKSVNCAAVSTKMGQAVCYAMQKYGAYNMDNNGSQYMAVYAQHRRSWSAGVSDYSAAGIKHDHQMLGLPTNSLVSLANWHG